MKSFKIINAKYLEGYKIELKFNDDTEKIIDFSDLLKNSHFPNERKFLDIDNFKQFKIEIGDLIWNDYDMCFQAKNLYNNILRK